MSDPMMGLFSSMVVGFVSIIMGLLVLVGLAVFVTAQQWPRPNLAGFAVGCALAAVVVFGVFVMLAGTAPEMSTETCAAELPR